MRSLVKSAKGVLMLLVAHMKNRGNLPLIAIFTYFLSLKMTLICEEWRNYVHDARNYLVRCDGSCSGTQVFYLEIN